MEIGAQLWLFNQVSDEAEMASILSRLGEAGYRSVETMFGKPPWRAADLERFGLTPYAAHLGLSTALDPQTKLIDALGELGAKTVCVSGLIRWNERSADDYRRSAKALNTLGQMLQGDGISLHYHNHDFEFALVEGDLCGMDLLLGELDFGSVSLCFDADWAALAGAAPADFMIQNAPRIGTLYLRDFKGKESVRLGAGDIDLGAILHAAKSLPSLKAIQIEQDPGTATPVEDMAASLSYLENNFDLSF